MKKIFILLFAGLVFSACKKEDEQIAAPSDVSNITVAPRVGGAVVKWKLPTDSNFLYVEVRYLKKGQVVKTNVSKYTDSVLINGLLNKLDYIFEVQPYNKTLQSMASGQLLTSATVKPIKRPIQVLYLQNELTKLDVTAPMIDTYTQETSEGPKVNLVDGLPGTYWHSAWSGNVQPLPHWIKVNFTEKTPMGAIKYFFRQNTSVNGRPTQIALDVSEDGVTYERKWTSIAGLSTSTPVANENTLVFDKNYESKFFKILILATQGNTTFVTLGDMSFHKMATKLTDLEALAEQNY